MSFILINVVKKYQCLDIMKINELVHWLFFFYSTVILAECAMWIINNGVKSKDNIVLVTFREGLSAHEWIQQGGCTELCKERSQI